MRPVSPADKAALEGAFERLSPKSRYRRFLSQTPRLSQRDLAYLTAVDHRRHEAVIAFDVVSGEAVGTARYVCDSSDACVAEPALAVVDEWQGRGLGSALLERLIHRARVQGVREFHATVLAENQPMLQLRRTSSQIDQLGIGQAAQGTVEVRAGLQGSRVGER